jgi:hypothetical protein
MSNRNDKIQIAMFSTNEKKHTPFHIFNSFLKQYNTTIIKKIPSAMAFSMTLTGEEKSRIIMICSIFDLTKNYSGIAEVNCYLLFVDLENEDSNEKIQNIIAYINEYCKLSKKIFILGMVKGNDAENKYLTEEDIIENFETEQINYEYKEINLSNVKEFSNVLMDILIYSSKHPISEGNNETDIEDKWEEAGSSCEIY